MNMPARGEQRSRPIVLPNAPAGSLPAGGSREFHLLGMQSTVGADSRVERYFGRLPE
jgi:hypothetical protein